MNWKYPYFLKTSISILWCHQNPEIAENFRDAESKMSRVVWEKDDIVPGMLANNGLQDSAWSTKCVDTHG